MKVKWGQNAISDAPVEWDSDRVVNPHIGIFGDTGMGKTHQLLRLISAFLATSTRRPRFHVFDAHGDIHIPGASMVRFHESADFGFNPLELNPDPEFGGVRKRIQSLIGAINKSSVRLGHRQERTLSKLLTSLYAEYGFLVDDPSTWGLDKQTRPAYPTLQDAITYARDVLRAMYTGSNQRAVKALQDVNRVARQLRAKAAAGHREKEQDQESQQKDLEALKGKAAEAYMEALKTINSGYEFDDALESDGQDETLKSIIDRLENLYAIGIYRSTPPPLDPHNPVWQYIITSLSQSEKKLFTATRLETIFTRAVQRGPQRDILEVVVLDEAHLYQDKDDDYIINRMVREVRKFGVAMVFASQGLDDYPETLLASLGTKVIIGIDRTYRRVAMTKFGLNDEALDFIVPMRRILVQIKNRGELNSATHRTMLET